MQVLVEPTECRFVDIPLQDAVDYLAKRHRVNIVVDRTALRQVGIPADVPVTGTLSGITLESALNLLVGELDVTWTIQEGVLTITTPERSQEQMIMVSYVVRDLVVAGGGNTGILIDVVTSTVAPASWNRVGGAGTVRFDPVRSQLVVTNSFRVHRQLQRLLEDLREVRGR